MILGGAGRWGPREPQEAPGQQMGPGDNQSECADTTQGPSPTKEMHPTEGWGLCQEGGGSAHP